MVGGKVVGPRPMEADALAAVLRRRDSRSTLIVDSRPFVEFASSHIVGAVNVGSSTLVKRRLQQDRVSVRELVQHAAQVDTTECRSVVVYDQSTRDVRRLAPDHFVCVLLAKLERTFPGVALLTGGFAAFSACFPGLVEVARPPAPLPSSISQPCLSSSSSCSLGPTCILPHLYLGSQRDVLDRGLMLQTGIAYVLNASTSCPRPDWLPESRFMRVPVNDGYGDKILPWLEPSVSFIDHVRVSQSRVLVHCLAGISRSATVAIAYVMRTTGLSSDDAYRFVKEKRPSISPNFNFLGQLLEYERGLRGSKWSSISIPQNCLGPPTPLPANSHERVPNDTPDDVRATGRPAASLCNGRGHSSSCSSSSCSSSSSSEGSGGGRVGPPVLMTSPPPSPERVHKYSLLKRSFSLNLRSTVYPAGGDSALTILTPTEDTAQALRGFCLRESPAGDGSDGEDGGGVARRPKKKLSPDESTPASPMAVFPRGQANGYCDAPWLPVSCDGVGAAGGVAPGLWDHYRLLSPSTPSTPPSPWESTPPPLPGPPLEFLPGAPTSPFVAPFPGPPPDSSLLPAKASHPRCARSPAADGRQSLDSPRLPVLGMASVSASGEDGKEAGACERVSAGKGKKQQEKVEPQPPSLLMCGGGAGAAPGAARPSGSCRPEEPPSVQRCGSEALELDESNVVGRATSADGAEVGATPGPNANPSLHSISKQSSLEAIQVL
ncbi:dual specificity protein phosphatase 8-like [Petromyzon marinus]|uniref:Dual specificity protein phosphatase 8 n=1 Tax=Petromyzon marinus TaxID=7757 RepID=A0AAJ7U0J1_PETMA|nr:dual specificity protein phosphatase 8-like [Petromyzon marinus]